MEAATQTDDPDRANFETFVAQVEPRLSRALVARFGRDGGREATVDALVYGWRNWDRVRGMTNPVGYLYRVGCSSYRPQPRPMVLADAEQWADPWIEPGLDRSLANLSDLQRTAVVLHHSFDWTYVEIGELLNVSVSTVRNHIDRGMRKLRQTMQVVVDG
jgi:RNA polymerase sigma-70 factor (ECF subfamily)